MSKNQSTAMIPNAQQQMDKLKSYLFRHHDALRNIAPKALDPERMIRLALGAASKTPKLLQCSPQSWLLALFDCAFYGLEPNPVLGHAYLIPYKNKGKLEVQFMAGYKGLVLLTTQTGYVTDVDASMVYENDRFEERKHDDPPFIHVPPRLGEDRGEVIGAYAYARLASGATKVRVLSVADIESYRARSKAKDSGPWVTDWNAMAMKTAFRRLTSYLPIQPGSKLGVALSQDEALERGEVAHAQVWTPDDDDGPDLASRLEDAADDDNQQTGLFPE